MRDTLMCENRVFIVAEIGVNHNGDVELGKRLIGAAARAGADAVKTQLFDAERMTSVAARKAAYQEETTGAGESQLAMLSRLELDVEKYTALRDCAASLGVAFFAAPFDIGSVRTLARLGTPIYKVPSGEITNLPYLLEIARQNARVFLSTGMSAMDEVRAAVGVFAGGGSELTLLHCHTQYPTDYADVNLRAIGTLRREIGLPVGFSDHTPGIAAAVAAVALGAVVIEKHLTISRLLPGPDHRASLEPGEFAAMTAAIRDVESALGDGVKRATPSELPNMAVARKSIVASRDIAQGEVFTEANLTTKRPGDGVSPMRWRDVIGRAAGRAYVADELLDLCEID